MRKSWLGFLAVALFTSLFTGAAEQDETTLRVMTYNIRYNNPGDGINAWPNRKDHVAEMIGKKANADLAGLQEALREQIDDLAARLPGYAWFGVGRDDGKDAGEFTPIFYRTDRFELLDHNTFWLSETPEVPGSKSWDAAITRIVTWGKFKEKASGIEFYHFNTHFDHIGRQARTESAKLVWKKIQELAPGRPVILTGDFNVPEKSEAYRVLTGATPEAASVSDLQDARYLSQSGHQGPTSTFVNADWTQTREPESKIDFIFVRKGMQVLSHKVMDDQYDGRFPSDHLPVVAELKIVKP